MGETVKRRISISPVTRIEGHARITLQLDGKGRVEEAFFHVNEFRGFERFCEGRYYTEMSVITPRICGICPVSHILASVKACEAMEGIRPPANGERLRRLIHLGQNVASHALSFFHLSAPDLLLGFDAPPEKRNLFGVADAYPDIAVGGIRLRKFGQEVGERITGRKVHSAGIVPGGMTCGLSDPDRDALLAWMPEAKATARKGLDIIRDFLEANHETARTFAVSPTMYLGTVGPDGTHELYDGRLRFVDRDGDVTVDGADPSDYLSHIAERSVDWSYLTWPYFRQMGVEQGVFRVGPLARLNVAERMKTPEAQREFRIFRQLNGGKPVHGALFYHYARMIETIAAIEEMERLLEDAGIMDTDIRSEGRLNGTEGVGSCEAPRGTLFHHYRVDGDGKLTKVNLLIATAQNNPSMNRSIREVAAMYVDGNDVKEGMLNRVEAAIRCYDPCLSCSTHAMGRMPMAVDLLDRDGVLLRRIERG